MWMYHMFLHCGLGFEVTDGISELIQMNMLMLVVRLD